MIKVIKPEDIVESKGFLTFEEICETISVVLLNSELRSSTLQFDSHGSYYKICFDKPMGMGVDRQAIEEFTKAGWGKVIVSHSYSYIQVHLYEHYTDELPQEAL